MTKIAELRVASIVTPTGQERATQDIINRLNQVIRAINAGEIEVPPAASTPGPKGDQGDPGLPGPAGADGADGTGATRATISHITGSLANLAIESGVIALAKGLELYLITANKACWVTFYSTAAARTADSSRTIDIAPTPGTGVQAEFSFVGPGTLNCGPVPIIKNTDTVPSADIYYKLVNLSGSTGTVQLDLTYLPTEV